jgi:site-specific recombinase XerD
MQNKRGILDRSEVERLLDACGDRSYAPSRLRAAIALMYRTGMRPGEMLGLQMGDVYRDPEGRMIVRINRPKGHAKIKDPSPPRELFVDSRTTAYYNEWLRNRGNASGPIFCNMAGERMTPQYFGRALKSAARRAGIQKRVHAHGLRHSFAHSHYYDQLDLGALMGALGHRKPTTTEIYLQNIGCTPRVVASMEAREW